MKVIKRYSEMIDEEIESAKCYAEMSIECKAKGENQYYSKFHQMAEQEIEHAITVHDYTVRFIELIKPYYQPTQDMQDAWDKSHTKYVEKVAWVRQMLAM